MPSCSCTLCVLIRRAEKRDGCQMGLQCERVSEQRRSQNGPQGRFGTPRGGASPRSNYFHGEYIVLLEDGTQLKLSRTYRDSLESIAGRLG